MSVTLPPIVSTRDDRPGPTLAERLASQPRGRPAAQSDFARILGTDNRLAPVVAESEGEEARAVAEQFVAKVFIEPMLALVRESNTQPPPFGPGPGEKEFGALIDAQRAMEMVRSARWPIVDRLAGDLSRSAAHPEKEIGPEGTGRLDSLG